jgi:hypothetical protein
METKQTAVEWLVNVVQSCIAPNYIPKEIIKQALQMEREQITDVWMDGMDGILHKIAAEKYYNKTYGGKNE